MFLLHVRYEGFGGSVTAFSKMTSDNYKGSFQNGLISHDFDGWPKAFSFEGVFVVKSNSFLCNKRLPMTSFWKLLQTTARHDEDGIPISGVIEMPIYV